MPTIDTEVLQTKLTKNLIRTRNEFKSIFLQTAFVGKCIDNRRDRRRLAGSSLGPVANKQDFLEAHKIGRILAVLKMREAAKFRAMLTYGGPDVHTDFHYHRKLDYFKDFEVKALVLNVHDSKTLQAIKANEFVAFAGRGVHRSLSMHGVLGTMGNITVYGTDDTNVDTPVSYIIHASTRFDQVAALPAPFTFNWYWHDSPENLTVDCTANLAFHHYTATPLML